MTSTLPGPDPQVAQRRSDAVRGPLARVRRRPLAIITASILLLIIGVCLLAPLIAPYDPNTNDLANALAGPSREHLLGTDQLGRDLLSRLLYGGIPSLSYAAIVLVVSLLIGIPLGLAAGYLGGRSDRVIATAAEIGLAAPVIIVTIVILTVFGDHFPLAMAMLGVLLTPPIIRNVRGAVIAVRRENFVDAARVAGLSSGAIMRKHILPRVAGPVLVQVTLVAGVAIGFTVGLSFLGFGPKPPAPTWGGMIQEASLVLNQSGWSMFVSGVVIVVVVLALMILGDTFREATVDPSAGRTGRSPAAMRQSISDPIVPGDSLLELRDLKVGYVRNGREVLVVDGVSFSVARGEAVGIVGESGCGKSTVARAVARILAEGGRTVGGSVRFGDRSVLDLDAKALQNYRGGSVGFVFQDPMGTLEPSMRVGDLLEMVVRIHHRVSRREARQRALDLLERVRIKDPKAVARKFPHELSGGLAQRVAIARAIAGEPDLLIADEPTTALDASIRLGILDLIRALQQESGMAVIIVSHDWDVISHVCDRAIVMYAGQVAEAGCVTDLLEHSGHPYTRALLECRPETDADRSIPLVSIPGQVAPPGEWPSGCRFVDRCCFATDACREAAVPLIEISETQSGRCLYARELVGELDQIGGSK